MNNTDLSIYKLLSEICSSTLRYVEETIDNYDENCVKSLCETCDSLILEKCKEYKSNGKLNKYYLSVPTNISLNDCVGKYIYQPSLDQYNFVKPGDIVKIEVGLVVDGVVFRKGKTFIKKSRDVETDSEKKLKQMYMKKMIKRMKSNLENDIDLQSEEEMNTDDLKLIVETELDENYYIALENSVIYQTAGEFSKTDESKYFVLNYKQVFDDEDFLLYEDNCFLLENGDVFYMDILFVEKDEDTQRLTYKQKHEPHIYTFNNVFSNLKLKSSKQFMRTVKNKTGNAGSFFKDDTDLVRNKDYSKNKLGIKECCETGILETSPVLYNKQGRSIYSEKFMLVVKNNRIFIF
jgi:methionine aminopeptidase